jgi:hypothetical protein
MRIYFWNDAGKFSGTETTTGMWLLITIAS